MSSFSTPLPGESAVKLGALAVLAFALAAVMALPAFRHDTGIPDMSELVKAHGRVRYVHQEKYGVKFRLYGHTETFAYPSKARGYDIVASALATAGDREAALLYHPSGQTALLRSEPYFDVWQLAIDGKAVRTFAQSREGWRSDNAIASWLFACSLAGGAYFSLLAWRARTSRKRF